MFGLLLAAAVATAPAGPAAPAAVAKASDPLVCRMEPIEGSRITHKVCAHASEDARRRQEARDMVVRLQGSFTATTPMMGPMH
jgi:hypothetical protein